MTQALHTAPVCEKHGCEKVWQRSKADCKGGRWLCPECRIEYRKKYYAKTSAKAKAKACAWQKDNPERAKSNRKKNYSQNAVARREYTKAWNKENPERRQQNRLRWKEENPLRHRELQRKWDKANPDKRNAMYHRYRARKLAATVPGQPVTAAVIAERLALFDGCAYCGANEKLEVDHFVALNDGGLHVPYNLVGACGCCNRHKTDKPVEQWFKSQPFFSVERWKRLNEITCA